MTFFCPQCDVVVQLKVGDVVIPHFAHIKDASCSAVFSEGESKEHLQGKQQLYEFLLEKVGNVKLEPYFKRLAQRPDLLVKMKEELVPIEFQCSTIPISQIKSRTSGYMRAKMKPIWILHTPVKLKTLPQGVGVFHLSRFEESFITYTIPEGSVLLTYNSHSEQFHYFSSLFHVTGRQYIGIHRILSIQKQIFPFARPKIPSAIDLRRYAWLYISMRKKFLSMRVLLNRRGINDPFLRQCYELRMLPLELPLWIGIPISSSSPFFVQAIEWQLALVHFTKRRGLQFVQLTEAVIYNFVRQFEGSSDKQVATCLKYRDFLLSQGIESPVSATKFDEEQLIKSIALTILAKRSED